MLSKVAAGRTIYFVEIESENWRGDLEFVLVSPDVRGGVFGFIDEEYGWPVRVEAAEISDAL